MKAGRERIDLGGGYGCYVQSVGYAVYSPHGSGPPLAGSGYRVTLEGARQLAQRLAVRCGEARA